MPVSGVWKMTYSTASWVNSGNFNEAFLYINGDLVRESAHSTISETGQVRSTGGRQVTWEASQGDNIEYRTTYMTGNFNAFICCAEYLPKM